MDFEHFLRHLARTPTPTSPSVRMTGVSFSRRQWGMNGNAGNSQGTDSASSDGDDVTLASHRFMAEP